MFLWVYKSITKFLVTLINYSTTYVLTHSLSLAAKKYRILPLKMRYFYVSILCAWYVRQGF